MWEAVTFLGACQAPEGSAAVRFMKDNNQGCASMRAKSCLFVSRLSLIICR